MTAILEDSLPTQVECAPVPDAAPQKGRLIEFVPWLGWSDVVFFVLTASLSLVCGAFLSVRQVTDPFLYYDVAFTRSIGGQAQLAFPHHGPYASLSFVPGREMLMLQLANMMGISPQTLQFLPLGDIALGMIVYLVCRKLFLPPPIACLTAAYLSLDLSTASTHYSVFAHALALPLFFAFIVFTIRFLDRRAPIDGLVAFLLFATADAVHYTVAAWFILFLLGANGALWLQKRLSAHKPLAALRPAHALVAAAVVTYLGIDDVVYKSFIPLVSPGTFESAQQRFLGYLSAHPSTSHYPYLYVRPSSVGLVGLVTLAVVLFPVLAGFLTDLWRLFIRRASSLLADPTLAFTLGIIMVGLFDTSAYSTRGSISTKSFSLVFPLLAMVYMRRLNRPFVTYATALLLVASLVIKDVVFYTNSYVIGPHGTASTYQAVAPSSQWMQAHVRKTRFTLLADLSLYGKYLVDSVHEKHQPLDPGFHPEDYTHVVGTVPPGDPWQGRPNLVAVDTRSSEPTTGFVFQLFHPLRDHLGAIKVNRRLDLVYDDGTILLAKPTKH